MFAKNYILFNFNRAVYFTNEPLKLWHNGTVQMFEATALWRSTNVLLLLLFVIIMINITFKRSINITQHTSSVLNTTIKISDMLWRLISCPIIIMIITIIIIIINVGDCSSGRSASCTTSPTVHARKTDYCIMSTQYH